MPTELSADEVLRIATLARLDLTADEQRLFARQLADVLTYADQLRQVDTTGTSPTAHALTSVTPLRADALEPSLARRDALANAPEADLERGLFKVPRVIGG